LSHLIAVLAHALGVVGQVRPELTVTQLAGTSLVVGSLDQLEPEPPQQFPEYVTLVGSVKL
jgi:hypothetical protein